MYTGYTTYAMTAVEHAPKRLENCSALSTARIRTLIRIAWVPVIATFAAAFVTARAAVVIGRDSIQVTEQIKVSKAYDKWYPATLHHRIVGVQSNQVFRIPEH
eukprot:SAG11_NODE_2014_length_3922_cov_1.929898_5_plen_102_part_01